MTGQGYQQPVISPLCNQSVKLRATSKRTDAPLCVVAGRFVLVGFEPPPAVFLVATVNVAQEPQSVGL